MSTVPVTTMAQRLPVPTLALAPAMDPDWMTVSHLLVAAANVVIPLQLLLSLYRYPHRHNLPRRLISCLILLACLIFLSGVTQLLLAMGYPLVAVVHHGNALVSVIAMLYLAPIIPDMFTLVDQTVSKLTHESKESKAKLFTFMAFLCHEIRNPLFAITSSAECLQDTPLSGEQEEEVSSISDSSLLMLRLVNDVLDLSRLDSGKLELECRAFDLHSLLKRLGDNMARQVQRKHQGSVTLQCSVSPSVPQRIMGDSVRILQIIYNLLSNSCKFTSQGTISLKVQARGNTVEEAQQQQRDEDEEEDDPDHKEDAGHTVTMSANRPVSMFAGDEDDSKAKGQGQQSHGKGAQQLFSMELLGAGDSNHAPQSQPLADEDKTRSVVLSVIVEDTGCGISPERLEDIFEPYTQAKMSDFRQHGGTGLGLSIISSLTKTMGGSISVTSKPGEGTKFHLRLPLQLPADCCNNNNDESENGNGEDDTTERLMMGESSFRRDSSFRRRKTLDYIGAEYLPSNQAEVPKQFLKCQRLPSCLGLVELDQKTHTFNAQATTMMTEARPSPSKAKRTLALAKPPPALPPAPLFPLHDHSNRTTGSLCDDDCPTTSSPTLLQIPKPSTKLPSFQLPSNESVVLIVDDNSVNLKILAKMLTTYKIEHRAATNGQEAVDALLDSRNYGPNSNDASRPRYSLVFMDISMPVMDGNTAIRIIRESKINVPIVALSANVLSDERDRTIALGADEFHTKPILRNTLHDICCRHLLSSSGSSASSALPALEAASQDSEATNDRSSSSIGISPPSPSASPTTNTKPLFSVHEALAFPSKVTTTTTSSGKSNSQRSLLAEAAIASFKGDKTKCSPALLQDLRSSLTKHASHDSILTTRTKS